MDLKYMYILFTIIIFLDGLWFYIGYEGALTKVHKNFAKTECARYSPITGEFEIIQKD